MIAVKTRPIRIPRSGLLKEMNRFWNASDSFKGANTASIVFIPRNKIPRPTKIPAISLCFFLWANRMIKAPIPIRTGAKEEGFNNLRINISSPRSPRRKICAVAVLPTLAPNTTGIA